MPKTTMRPVDENATKSPSQEVVDSASRIKYETDERGRKIGVIKPSALLRFRLFKILGAEGSKNEQLLGSAMLAFVVREIDGKDIMPPNTERELETLIGLLDDDGLMAIAKCLVEQHGVAAPTGDEAEQKAILKN